MGSVESFLSTPSITQSLLWLTIVMTIGLWLGEKAKIKNFSFGVTWVLFVGIALASLGVKIDHSVAQFAKDFGLILFVYSIGLQVGPSFRRPADPVEKEFDRRPETAFPDVAPSVHEEIAVSIICRYIQQK